MVKDNKIITEAHFYHKSPFTSFFSTAARNILKAVSYRQDSIINPVMVIT